MSGAREHAGAPRSAAVAGHPATPRGPRPARLLVERNVVAYRRGWIFLVSGFFEPLFYLMSIVSG